MTQRQELNEMSNLELAIFLCGIMTGKINRCDLCIYDKRTCHGSCVFGIEQWLRSESEEE